MRLRAGDFVDDMEIVGLLGEGATSEVYLIRDHAGIFRALKLLSVHGSAHRRRMRIEGQALRHLRHENVVGVLAMVEHEGWMGVLMEYVPGPTLHRWMDVEATTVDEAVRLTRGILTGVDVLHQAGLVHRDIKPGNVLLDVSRDGVRPRLADFGLVKQLWGGDGHTHTGVSMGTPTYMAPEQLKDASRVDGRADLFSVGCLLFEMLTGRAPFDRSDMFEAWKAIDGGQVADMSLLPTNVPFEIAEVIEGLLEPDPEQRIPSVDVVFKLLDGQPPPRPLPPAPPLESGSEGALRARRLSEEMYRDVKQAAPGDRQDLRGIDPTTFNSEHVEELMLFVGEEPVEEGQRHRRRTSGALWVTGAVLVLLIGVATWFALTVDGSPPVTANEGLVGLDAPDGQDDVGAVGQEPPDGAEGAEPSAGTGAEAGADPQTSADGPPPSTGTTLSGATVAPTDVPVQDTRIAQIVPAVVASAGSGGATGSSEASPSEAGDGAEGAGTSEGAAGEGEDAGDTDMPMVLPATVAIAGDAFAVEIVGSNGAVYDAGELEPGSYSVRARWTEADAFQGAGPLEVGEGEVVTLRCSASFLRCRR